MMNPMNNASMNSLVALLAGLQPQTLSGNQKRPQVQQVAARPVQQQAATQVTDTETGTDTGVYYDPWDHNFQPDPSDPNKDGDGDGKDGEETEKLSRLQKQMQAMVDAGPSGYSNAIRKNLGMNEPTIGYGNNPKNDTSGMTRLMGLFSGNPTNSGGGGGGGGGDGTPRPHHPNRFNRRDIAPDWGDNFPGPFRPDKPYAQDEDDPYPRHLSRRNY